MHFLGIDLAWGEGSAAKLPADTGVVALDGRGRVIAAGWTCGIAETLEWVEANADLDALLFVDAPLVVNNERGQRLCEQQTGQRYGRWKVSANTTNLGSPRLAGVALRGELEVRGATPTAARDLRPGDASSASATHTRRWSVLPNSDTTLSGRATSDRRRGCRRRRGARFVLPPATSYSGVLRRSRTETRRSICARTRRRASCSRSRHRSTSAPTSGARTCSTR
jgi:hypothetical protein